MPAVTSLPVSPVRVTVRNLSEFALGLPPPINFVLPKGASLTFPIEDESQLNNQDLANAVNRGLVSFTIVERNTQGGLPSLPLDVVRMGELRFVDHFMDLVADGVVIHLRSGPVAAGTVLAVAFTGVQTDHPRTAKIVNAGAGVGLVNIHGLTSNGEGHIESINITAAGTFEGGVAWARIDSIDFPALGGGDSMSVQMSDKLGLAGLISSQVSVFKVNKNGANLVFLATDVDASFGTFDTGGIAAGDDFTLRYKP